MTAEFGPTGMHPDWCDERGRPTEIALEKFPHVRARMLDGQHRVERALGWYQRLEVL